MEIVSANNITDKNKQVINIPSKQLTQIQTDFLTKSSVTTKTMLNKDIAIIENAVEGLEKEDADTLQAQIKITSPRLGESFERIKL